LPENGRFRLARIPVADPVAADAPDGQVCQDTKPHKRELIEDFKQNRASESVRTSSVYLDYIAAADCAAELAASGIPVWVVHAEKNGDGGLTDAELAASGIPVWVVQPRRTVMGALPTPSEPPSRVGMKRRFGTETAPRGAASVTHET